MKSLMKVMIFALISTQAGFLFGKNVLAEKVKAVAVAQGVWSTISAIGSDKYKFSSQDSKDKLQRTADDFVNRFQVQYEEFYMKAPWREGDSDEFLDALWAEKAAMVDACDKKINQIIRQFGSQKAKIDVLEDLKLRLRRMVTGTTELIQMVPDVRKGGVQKPIKTPFIRD